ncbi:MAG: dihydroorotate dehydrogenase electron transfer subunit [Caldilineaceae bacterium]
MNIESSRWTLPTAVAIREIRTDNYRTKTFVLDARWDAMPGQFAMVWLPRFDEKPFSLVNHDPVTLMITAVGPFSRQMHALAPGDRVWLRGPLGQGFTVASHQQRIALVGGGYGVAPLYWLARTQLARGVQVESILGARTEEDVLYAPHFAGLDGAQHRLHIATEDGSAGRTGRVTDVLAPLLEAGGVDGIYACGPHGMLAALAQMGERYNVPSQLSWEAYMRCGIGICGACEHDGYVLCMDGPVLNRGL